MRYKGFGGNETIEHIKPFTLACMKDGKNKKNVAFTHIENHVDLIVEKFTTGTWDYL